jgi:hypothetical protein
LILSNITFSQGCSDAGFCTMGAMKPDQNFMKRNDFKLRTLDLNQYLGLTHFKDFIHVTNAEVNFVGFKKYTFQAKIPYFYIKGKLGQNDGLGDFSLCATRPLVTAKKYSLNFTIGTKIPTNKALAKVGNATLPMYYQTSLGTFDFVTGVSLSMKGWLFATGYQQVLYSVNENDFKWAPFKELGLFEVAKQYHASVALKRGKDIMFRVEKNFNYSKFNFYVGLLDVWRLNEDEVTNPSTGKRDLVSDALGTSKGHALTLLTGLGYNLSVKSSLIAMYGDKLFNRQYNTDGLSRENVFTLGYQYKF